MLPVDLSLPGEKLVAVAGDWHGSIPWVQTIIPALARKYPGIKTILHAGDFGIWGGMKSHSYFAAIEKECERAGIERILVTPGNHESWDWLDADFLAMPGQAVPLTKRISVMPRAFRFTLGGDVAFMSFGGAASIDYQYRAVGYSWFLTEAPTDAHVEAAIEGGPVTVLITHETVNGGTDATERIVRSNPHGISAEALLYASDSRRRVTTVWEETNPRLLFHGHMHAADEKEFPDGKRVVSLGSDDQVRNVAVLDLDTLSYEWLDDVAKKSRARLLPENIAREALRELGDRGSEGDGADRAK